MADRKTHVQYRTVVLQLPEIAIVFVEGRIATIPSEVLWFLLGFDLELFDNRMLAPHGQFDFGPFSLDTGQLLLKRAGIEVPLTPKAATLLRVLVENSGRIIEKSELIEKVWPDSFVEEGNLAYTILLLRKALGDNAVSPKYIENIPRRGYRFIVATNREVPGGLNDPGRFGAQNAEPDYNELIGRQRQTNEILCLLQKPNVRLLTLTGTGGTGKTRLAREVSEQATSLYAEVEFVELANVSDPQLMATAIANHLAINETGNKPTIEALSDYFRNRTALLILDNFEQIISAGTQLIQLIKKAPDLKIVVTSREPIKLTIEKEFRVPPLDLPESVLSSSISDLMRFSATKLFVLRAKSARPDLKIQDEDAAAICEICNKLDGLPLALELAASRAKVLSISEIYSRLENSLALLTGGSRDVAARQQTMRATIEWSFGLLNDFEKTVFVSLAVFEGSFTLKSAECVLAGIVKGDSIDDPFCIVNAVESLVDKGLLSESYSSDGELRFRMLVVIRDFALTLLCLRTDYRQLQDSHARVYSQIAETAVPHLFRPNSAEWLDKFADELDNIRAALRWALENSPKLAAEIVSSVRHLAALRIHTKEARYWLERALEGSAEISPELKCELFTGLGVVCQYQRDLEVSRKMHEENLQLSRLIGDKKIIARALRGVGAIDYMERCFESAGGRISEALQISRSIDDEFGEAAALARLADICNATKNHQNARSLIKQSLTIFKRLGYQQGVVSKLANLAITEFLLGNREATRQVLIEGLKMSIALNDEIDLRVNFETAAALLEDEGEYWTSAVLSGMAAARCEDMLYFHEPVEQRFRENYIAKLRNAMNENEFVDAVAEGRKMRVTDAANFALDVVSDSKKSVRPFQLINSNRI